jgi:hypothetical protein
MRTVLDGVGYRALMMADGVGGGAAPAGTDPAAVAAAVVPAAPAAPAPDAPKATEPASLLDSPSLLGSAAAKKPDAAAVVVEPPKLAAESVAADKNSPVEPAKAAPDAKAQDAPSADAKSDPKADVKAEGDKPKPDEAKAKEPDKDDQAAAEAKKAEDAAAAPPAPVVYEAFKAPEGIKLDDAKVKEFADIVGPAQMPQEKAQALVDLFGKSVSEFAQNYANEVHANQRKTWNNLNDEWKSEFRNDKEIGGNREQTSLAMAKAVIEEFLTPEQTQRYLAHIDLNGMSNFVEHIRLLSKIGEALNVFEDKIVASQLPKAPSGEGKGFRRHYKTNGATS